MKRSVCERLMYALDCWLEALEEEEAAAYTPGVLQVLAAALEVDSHELQEHLSQG